MAISIAELRQARTNEEIDYALSQLSLPDGMSVESFIVQLLDTYYTAQDVYNTNRPTGTKLDFVKTPTISNPQITGNAAQYSIDKSYVVRARVNTGLKSVEPLLQ